MVNVGVRCWKCIDQLSDNATCSCFEIVRFPGLRPLVTYCGRSSRQAPKPGPPASSTATTIAAISHRGNPLSGSTAGGIAVVAGPASVVLGNAATGAGVSAGVGVGVGDAATAAAGADSGVCCTAVGDSVVGGTGPGVSSGVGRTAVGATVAGTAISVGAGVATTIGVGVAVAWTMEPPRPRRVMVAVPPPPGVGVGMTVGGGVAVSVGATTCEDVLGLSTANWLKSGMFRTVTKPPDSVKHSTVLPTSHGRIDVQESLRSSRR